jgi:hypothetical protein
MQCHVEMMFLDVSRLVRLTITSLLVMSCAAIASTVTSCPKDQEAKMYSPADIKCCFRDDVKDQELDIQSVVVSKLPLGYNNFTDLGFSKSVLFECVHLLYMFVLCGPVDESVFACVFKCVHLCICEDMCVFVCVCVCLCVCLRLRACLYLYVHLTVISVFVCLFASLSS